MNHRARNGGRKAGALSKGKHRGNRAELVAGLDGGHVDGAAAHYRIRYVYCGKKRCGKCPHRAYRYLVWREGSKMKERYMGVAKPWEWKAGS
ncbi:MAG TPA: hypothetical protein VFF73_25170 [Planctomycetota bacterium]|nr:hypothetical protein [Planctomycetota bacterium]